MQSPRRSRSCARAVQSRLRGQLQVSIRLSSFGSWSDATSGRSTRLPPRREKRAMSPFSSVRGLRAPPLVRDVSLELFRGEILLGLGGLVGAGRSETVETLFGLRARAGGEVRFEGRPFAPRAGGGDPRRDWICCRGSSAAIDRAGFVGAPESAPRSSRRLSRIRPRL